MISNFLALSLAFNWYDLVVVVALLYGLWSGTRTGLSGEIIRVLALLLMIAAALHFYQPLGAWLSARSGLVKEVADLVAFVGIALLIYAVSLLLRAWIQRRRRKFVFGAAIENTGGALAGLLRMVAIMAWVTVILSLMRSPFWHQHVARESAFGAFVVKQLPAVKAVTEKQFPENFLLFRDLRRPEDPDPVADGPKKKR
jgi:uncharacterized membrane protein required for colicin V production